MQGVFEKIVGELNNYIKDNDAIYDTNQNYNGAGGFLKAIDVVEQAAAEYATDTNVGSNGWISVSERLPEESLNSVIGWDEYRERCVFVQYLQGQWKLGDWESVKITHWMNVPYQPKGE